MKTEIIKSVTSRYFQKTEEQRDAIREKARSRYWDPKNTERIRRRAYMGVASLIKHPRMHTVLKHDLSASVDRDGRSEPCNNSG